MQEQFEEFAAEWYRGFGQLPEIDSPYFSNFAANNGTLLEKVLTKNIYYSIIIDKNAPTAYFDIENGVIALPGYYFLKSKLQENFGEKVNPTLLALTLINGSQLHESLHAELTVQSMQWMLNEVSYRYGKSVDQNLLTMIINVMEDLYIENWATRKLSKNLNAFIDFKNDILFDDERIQENIDEKDYQNLFITLKRKSTRKKVFATLDEVSDKIQKLVDEYLSRTSLPIQTRIDYFFRMYQIFENNEELQSQSGGGEGNEDGETFQISVVGGNKEGQEIDIELDDDQKAELQQIQIDFENEINENIDEEYEKRTGSFKGSEEINYTYASDSNCGLYKGSLVEAKNSNSFAKMFRQKMSTKKVNRRLKEEGTKVKRSQIHRIKTSGKIFNKPTVEKRNRKPQIIHVIDISGSTTSTDVYHPLIGIHCNLKQASMAFCKKVHEALVSGNYPSGVVAHTTTWDSIEIYEIASHGIKGMRKSNNDDSWKRVANAYDGGNTDDLVLRKMAKKFDENGGEKVLIVYSDGEPNWHDGISSDPKTNLKKVVNDLRGKGITVISVSLVKGVVKSNNKIYGEEFNIDASGDLNQGVVKAMWKALGV